MRNLPLAALVALLLLASPMAYAKAVEFGVDVGVATQVQGPPGEARLESTSTSSTSSSPQSVSPASKADTSARADGLLALAALSPALSPAPLSDVAGLPEAILSQSVSLEVAAGGAGSLQASSQAKVGGAAGSEPVWHESITSGALAEAAAEAAPEIVATAGALALLQAFGFWRWLGVGAFALYSRLAKSELLDNGHRDRVYKLIQESPGIGLSEIAEKTGLGWGTTVYHLDRLERASFVASERAGLHRCYFPVGLVPKESRRLIGALKADTTRSIAEFLVTRPGATQTELCEALGMSASAASKQITKLEGAGLVRRERDWKTVHLFPEPALPTLLANESAEASRPAPSPLAA